MKLWKEQSKPDVNSITKNKVLNEASSPWIFISKLSLLKLSFGFSFQINTEIMKIYDFWEFGIKSCFDESHQLSSA